MCGTPLPGVPHEYGGDGGEVSPQAATVPLAGGGRQETGDIAQHDTRQPISAPTAPVGGESGDFWRGVEGPPSGPTAEAGAEPPLTIRVRPIDTSRPDAPARDSGESPHDSADATRYAEDETTRVARRPPARPRATPPAALPGPHAGPTPDAADAARPGGASHATRAAPARRTPEDRALRMWGGLAVFGVAIVVLAATAAGLGWYFMRSLRDTAGQPGAAVAPTAEAPPADARAKAAAKLAEAEGLLAAGRTDEAVALLRESAALDPSNAEPHRRLARLLLEGGARRTAIEELRAVLRVDAGDAKAWRELADAQLAEGLYRDAADSYRKLSEADEGARADDRVQLAYADALRQSGRESDAKNIYQRLASSRVAEVARSSRQRLAQLAREEEEEGETAEEASASPSPTASPARREERAAAEAERAAGGRAEEVSAGRDPVPATRSEQLSPRERYERGVRLWASNRQAAVSDFAAAAQSGNADANYYLGLNLAEGREPRAMKRGELMAALTYFQRARRGRHAGDARRYEDQLLREYDRRSGIVSREQ